MTDFIILQCIDINCGYWVPCSTKGEVPTKKERREDE